jgi:hypothetical protein
VAFRAHPSWALRNHIDMRGWVEDAVLVRSAVVWPRAWLESKAIEPADQQVLKIVGWMTGPDGPDVLGTSGFAASRQK